jgi:acyl-CoA synthetase (NDP forming)
VDTIFNPRYKMGRPEKGMISFISQSGATLCIIMDWMAHKCYRGAKFISYGNALNTDEADLIEYLVSDPDTGVICVYMEGIKNGRKFFEIAKANSRKIPIIALKGGVSDAAVNAVSTHTGSLAGAPEIYRAMFRQAGVIEASDLEQVFDFARVLSTQPMPRGKRIQIITNGGGFGVLMTDCIAKSGMELAGLNDEYYGELKKLISDHVVIRNPLDLTGDSSAEMYIEAIKGAMADPDVDMVAVILLLQLPTLAADIVEMVSEQNKTKKKPMIIISAGGEYTEVLKKSMEDYGIPCFSYPERAAMAMKALYDYSNFRGAKK